MIRGEWCVVYVIVGRLPRVFERQVEVVDWSIDLSNTHPEASAGAQSPGGKAARAGLIAGIL